MGMITVYCQPGASQTRLAGRHDGKPKLRLRAPAVGGAANKALLAFVAELCGVPLSRVSLHTGATSRLKQLEVEGLASEALAALFRTAD